MVTMLQQTQLATPPLHAQVPASARLRDVVGTLVVSPFAALDATGLPVAAAAAAQDLPVLGAVAAVAAPPSRGAPPV